MCFCWLSQRKERVEMYDMETSEIFVSRDVKFHENEFPFSTINVASLEGEDLNGNENDVLDVTFLDDLEHTLAENVIETVQPTAGVWDAATAHGPPVEPANSFSLPTTGQAHISSSLYSSPTLLPSSSGPAPNPTAQPDAPSPISTQQQAQSSTQEVGMDPLFADGPIGLGKGFRLKRPSVLLKDYVTHTVTSMSPSTRSPSTTGSSGTL